MCGKDAFQRITPEFANKEKQSKSERKLLIRVQASAARRLHQTQVLFPAINTISQSQQIEGSCKTGTSKRKGKKRTKFFVEEILVKEIGRVMTSLSQIKAEKKCCIQDT